MACVVFIKHAGRIFSGNETIKTGFKWNNQINFLLIRMATSIVQSVPADTGTYSEWILENKLRTFSICSL